MLRNRVRRCEKTLFESQLELLLGVRALRILLPLENGIGNLRIARRKIKCRTIEFRPRLTSNLFKRKTVLEWDRKGERGKNEQQYEKTEETDEKGAHEVADSFLNQMRKRMRLAPSPKTACFAPVPRTLQTAKSLAPSGVARCGP